MAYEFTFTPRFQKHFRNLTAREKNQLKLKLKLLAENPSHPSLRAKRIQLTICARVSDAHGLYCGRFHAFFQGCARSAGSYGQARGCEGRTYAYAEAPGCIDCV